MNCNDGRLETEIIRDLFTANMSNDEVQKDLLAETKTPDQALELLIRKQGSEPNTEITTVKTEPVGFITKRGNNNNNRYSSRGERQRQSQKQRGNPQRPSTEQKQQRFKCGNLFGPGHLQQCPAKDKICNKCTKRGHYARLCKPSEVNAIQEDQTAEQISQDTDVAAYVNYMQAGDLIPDWALVHPDDSTTNAIRFESRTVNQIDEIDLKGHLVRVRCGPNNLVFTADTGSPTSFINQRTANLIVSTVKSARRVKTTETDEASRMVCYNGYKIPSFGRVVGWTLDPRLIVVDDKRASILGRNILPQIGIQLQQKPAIDKVNQLMRYRKTQIAQIKKTNWVKTTYPGFCTRVGRARNHMVHTTFLNEFKALQQKGRRIPTHIQEKVEQELRSLIDQGHIVELEKCNDQQFISRIVITVKKDQSIKLAMDSKQINKMMHKKKYQMPNIDVLLDNVAQSAQQGHNKPGTTLFSTIDLRYAYSQLKLDDATREQSNFSIIGGHATGTYQYQTNFYGLTDMPAEFQKAIDPTLNKERDIFAFLDDILIISHGTKEDHMNKLKRIVDKLDAENKAISLEKSKLECEQVE